MHAVSNTESKLSQHATQAICACCRYNETALLATPHIVCSLSKSVYCLFNHWQCSTTGNWKAG